MAHAELASRWASIPGIPCTVKSGSVSFQPMYNTSTNRMASVAGCTPTYDGNGNATYDCLHTYSWDAAGKMLTVDSGTSNGVCLTYDALGRMVEQARGSICTSSYTQILYSPTGGKLALMNGQSVSKAFIPLPGGATAVYTSGPTLSYFRHPDWLGSSRFASTASRTMYYSGAYAPFGETYAEAGTPDRSFTGQNQDTVQGSTTGLYDFMFREYAQYGRWISPDPAGLGAVDPTNPQTWNRYAYVRNNPTGLVDPRGLDDNERCTLDGVKSICRFMVALESEGIVAQCPDNYCPIGIQLHDIGGGYASFYVRDPNLVLNCTNYSGNAQTNCLWSTNSLRWVADADVYPPMAQQLFQQNRQTWQNTNQVTDPRTLALWYGGSAAVALAPYVPEALYTSEVYVSATLEAAGVPVTAASVWTINNWRNIQNWVKVGTWIWNSW